MKNISISLLKVKDEEIEIFLKKLNEAIKNIERLNLYITIHFDVMDNKFVPNDGINIEYINRVKKYNFYIDTHLMVEKPKEENYVDRTINYGSDDVTIHIELPEFEKELEYLLEKKKSLNGNIKIGVAINPDTNIERIEKYLEKIDKVLIMSVVPGFGGQKYLDSATEKISCLKKNYPKMFVQVDGGINESTFKNALDAGVDSFVIGSYLTDDFNEIEKKLNILNNIIKNT